MKSLSSISFDNTYAQEMDGFFVPWKAAEASAPEIIAFNEPLCLELGLNPCELNSASGTQFFAGNEMPQGSAPIAQVYAGHQFGGFSPQLGDGRALLIGEVLDTKGIRKDIQLKGSGKTPFSRNGDGKAVVGPVLREYLMGEAMHALGVPTTRALAAVTTGEKVIRNGFEPGAILTRIASSHIRVGTFQFFAARRDVDKVRQLADYSIKRHYPQLETSENKYLELLRCVMQAQASLVAKWVSIGFVHGVMNTDNVTISGETIDYGPCAFMDGYDPKAVFSSIDEQGRYAYGNQPVIAQWNLARFAETLIQLIDADDNDRAIKLATDVLNQFPEIYQTEWAGLMEAKLGLPNDIEKHLSLINELHAILEGENVDYTMLFRNLADALRGDEKPLLERFNDPEKIKHWLRDWMQILTLDASDKDQVADQMDCVNPIYIARNHLVEKALQTASKEQDYEPFNKLLSVLLNPFTKRDGLENYEEPAPKGTGPYITYCGT